MKRYITALIALCFGLSAFAQTTTNPAPTFVKGNLFIDFATHKTDSPAPGVVDTYRFDVNVSNSAKFTGTVTQLPYLHKTLGSNQNGNLTFNLDCLVVNPKNPSQTKNIGTIAGVVPVTDKNVYDFADGTLQAQIFGSGTAPGFESKFGGYALGKPPVDTSLTAKFNKAVNTAKATLNFTKGVNGKVQNIAVTNYDIMEFKDHVLAKGPVPIYSEVTVNGRMVYDYQRNSWFFDHLRVEYWDKDNRKVQDTLTGDIRWSEDKNRKDNGLGQYIFDVRVNEPPPQENAVFNNASDESDFFAQDATAQGLSGTMDYKDQIVGDDNVLTSTVNIDLKGNGIEKRQTMYLAKLILYSLIVPFNSE